MSLQAFKYNVFGEVRPFRSKQFNDSTGNPYVGKFMVQFRNGETTICSYVFPPEEDPDDEWKPMWIKDSNGDKVEAQDKDLWYPMDYLFSFLQGYPLPYSCWEFGRALAEFAIPALDVWIRNGVSYPSCMKPEEWNEVLRKIKQAFVVSLADMCGETDDNDKALWEEHKRIRKEGFDLLVEHYLDQRASRKPTGFSPWVRRAIFIV